MLIRTISLTLLFALGIFFRNSAGAQQTLNTRPMHSFISVPTPKTPESQAFEVNGNFVVNEFSGAANISIPIYTLKSRNFQVPITLDYWPAGIRVNQEATWVGLGFDLSVGGRITVETRGCSDFSGATRGLSSPSNLATGMQNIFNRIGNNRELGVLTFASICEGQPGCANNSTPDDLASVQEMAEFGTGEPDIFHANFLGHSLSFYFDKTTSNLDLKWLGEQSTFNVTKTLDANNNITGWTIQDDDGSTYYFNQVEGITNTIPATAVVPTTVASAWLLTRIESTSGDYVNFTYSNYGYSIPAFTMNSYVDFNAHTSSATIGSDQNQNIAMQSPYYLTRMETQNIAVDFTLDTRTDLYGPGSRKLAQVKVTDKLSNTVKRMATFSYSYFQASVDANSRTYLNSLTYNLPSALSATDYLASSSSRLRLDQVTLNSQDATSNPYKFYYNTFVPDKYSLSQDHWGYYNAVTNQNNGYQFSHLIPLNGLGGVQPILNGNSAFSTAVGAGNLGLSRDCDPTAMQAMMLTKIEYPTGGTSEFTYEPHQSVMVPTVNVTGGGLRTKSISNYESGHFAGSTEYSYSGGRYMGNMEYYTAANTLASCTGQPMEAQMKLSTTGAINDNTILIGYSQTTTVKKDHLGNSNGSLVKQFNLNTNSGSYSNNGVGFDVLAAHWPALSPSVSNVWGTNTATAYLNAQYSGFAPTPTSSLEGRLMQEQYFDASNNLLKSVSYTYHLANYTNSFYSIRAIENRVGGFNLNCSGTYPNWGTSDGDRPVIIFVAPGKSYHTLTDAITEVNYSNGQSQTSVKTFTYDSYYKLKSESLQNSDNTTTTVTYTHPYDYVSSGFNGSTTMIYQMMGQHVYNPVFSSTTTKGGTTVNSTVSNFYTAFTGVYVPQSTQVQIGSNSSETRELYGGYDNFGNLLERQKPGHAKEDYLWGYNSHFPVAKVVGSDAATVNDIVNTATLNAPASDVALRNELNKLRTYLPNAQVTTYTYDPVFGMTSETDPNGHTTFYSYDASGRLSFIKDQDGNLVKAFCYSYTGQPVSCTMWGNDAVSQSFTKNNCATDYTGTTGTYSIPANTYFSAISKTDANGKAQADVTGNGQNYINTNALSGAACNPNVKFTNSSSPAWTIVFTNTATNVSTTFSGYPSMSNVTLGNVSPGTYTITFTPSASTSVQISVNGSSQTGSTITFTNVAVSAPVNINIANYSSGPCSFTMSSGYSSPTNSISNNGTTVSFYLVFYSSSSMSQGNSYLVATINGGCRPSAVRTINTTAGGRNWTITIYPDGRMYWQMAYGSATLNANSTISTGTLSYAL